MLELSTRQLEIVDLVRKRAPITGEQIAEALGVTRPSIRSDLGLLAMLGYIDAKPKVGYFPAAAPSDAGASGQDVVLRMRVKEIMGVPVVLRETATVGDAVVSLFLENVGSLIVVDATGSLSGIVSRKDLLKVAVGNAHADAVILGMVMTRYPNIVTVAPDDTVLDAMRKMIQHEVDGLPVVQAHPHGGAPAAEVVGRITKTTILKLIYEAAVSRDMP